MDNIETGHRADNPTSDARREANQANAQHHRPPHRRRQGRLQPERPETRPLRQRPHRPAPRGEEFAELLEQHLTSIQPVGVLEHTLLDEMVSATWNLRRSAAWKPNSAAASTRSPPSTTKNCKRNSTASPATTAAWSAPSPRHQATRNAANRTPHRQIMMHKKDHRPLAPGIQRHSQVSTTNRAARASPTSAPCPVTAKSA